MTQTYPCRESAILPAEVFTERHSDLRRTGQPSYWAEKNRRGAPADSFLEGPSFDTEGNLYFVDIPFGRVFRADPAGRITQIAEYDGQPNGLKIHRDGRIFLADYQNGIMLLDPATGTVRKALGDAMWSVALADGARDDDEEIQLLAIETALGLSDADMTAAREKALNAL